MEKIITIQDTIDMFHNLNRSVNLAIFQIERLSSTIQALNDQAARKADAFNQPRDGRNNESDQFKKLNAANTSLTPVNQPAPKKIIKQDNFNTMIANYTKISNHLKLIKVDITNNIIQQNIFNNTVQDGVKNIDSLGKRLLNLTSTYINLNSVKKFFGDSLKAANEQIRAEERLQAVMRNTPGMTQDGIDHVKNKAYELQGSTSIKASTGIAGQSQLAEYVYDPTNLEKMTQAMYDLAAETYGAKVNQEQMIQTASFLGKAMSGDKFALAWNGFKAEAVFTTAEQELLRTGTEAERTALVIKMVESSLSGMAQNMAQTFEGRVESLKNAWSGIMEKIGYGVLPIFTQFVAFIQTNMPLIENVILNVFSNVIQIMQQVLQAAIGTVSFFINNWTWIEPIIWGLVAAMGTYLIVNKGFLLVTQAISVALRVAAVAQQFFNMVMAMNPILLVIMLVIALITTLYRLWQTNDAFAAGFLRAWNGILNFFDQVAIFFVSVWMGIINGFNTAKINIMVGFQKMLDFLVDRLNGFIDLLNNIPGVSIDAVSRFDLSPQIADARAKAGADKKEGQDIVRNMQDKAAKKANERDQGVQNLLKDRAAKRDADKADRDKMFQKPPVNNPLPKGPWNVGDNRLNFPDNNNTMPANINKVNEVGRIGETVDISNEDLKVMRDLAEMKAIQNFVTLTPTVQVTTGDIKSTNDVDSIIRKIEEAMKTEIKSAAQGAYA
ncbi:hypothetical protein [Paenibacillus pinihumi]|uniref:hypothetical protein n=1 Tax=Paenibacillus pinihumi TaxID=669462 RepID=UPI0012B59022|nr:hypothetical protein [Paenibacillus pinihumi]